MALVPIISQSWDTTSVFTPTRMNNIEQNIAILHQADGIEYASGVSVKDAISNLFKTTNCSGTTTNSGALLMPSGIAHAHVLAARCTSETNVFAFPRGDGYFTVFRTYNNDDMAPYGNANVAFEVTYY